MNKTRIKEYVVSFKDIKSFEEFEQNKVSDEFDELQKRSKIIYVEADKSFIDLNALNINNDFALVVYTRNTDCIDEINNDRIDELRIIRTLSEKMLKQALNIATGTWKNFEDFFAGEKQQ